MSIYVVKRPWIVGQMLSFRFRIVWLAVEINLVRCGNLEHFCWSTLYYTRGLILSETVLVKMRISQNNQKFWPYKFICDSFMIYSVLLCVEANTTIFSNGSVVAKSILFLQKQVMTRSPFFVSYLRHSRVEFVPIKGIW